MAAGGHIAAGIDLGGTKIEAQVFTGDWQIAQRQRWPTPPHYPDLLAAMSQALAWCENFGGQGLPIGVSSAGLINPSTGRALTANLAASGQAFPADVAAAAGRGVVWVNDCRALALSEAQFGAAQGCDPALVVIFGTGVSGGVISSGKMLGGFAGVGGEVGHFALPAAPILAHGLPILPCGCGRIGCVETYLSAAGLSRIAQHITGRALPARQVLDNASQDAGLAQAWDVWLDIAAEFLLTLTLTIDPAAIILGGGLSNARGICADVSARLGAGMFAGFPTPPVRLAQGGDTSGARGAAFAAFMGAQNG